MSPEILHPLYAGRFRWDYKEYFMFGIKCISAQPARFQFDNVEKF
jgi:hypothetical protein